MKAVFILVLFVALCLYGDDSCQYLEECCEGVPNTSARLDPDCSDFDIFAGLLIWTAKEAGADCWAEVITTDSTTLFNDLREVDFGWNPGFRAGIGYGLVHDQWDTQAYYTWFRTTEKDQVASGNGAVHSTFLGNFYVNNATGAGISGPAYQRASISWIIRFNIFDWELGRNFWVSQSLALRPFIGIKGGWIHQTIHSKWENPNLSPAEFFNEGKENIKNNFWGVGPAAGVNTKWNLFNYQCHAFNLLGDFSGALMWGHWTFSDLFRNDINEQVAVNLENLNSGATMVRTFMGLNWEFYFGSVNWYRFSAKLGYEMQFWLDQLQFYSFVGGRLNNQLTLQGGTLEFCFDF